jgi:hypothetical protein
MTEHSDRMGMNAAAQYERRRRAHLEIMASVRGLGEPEADRVVRRLSHVIHRLTVAIAAELDPPDDDPWDHPL